MMYRCENCGHLFEEGEQAVWEERHGLDTPPYEEWSGCPECLGDYEEVCECTSCGGWYKTYELYTGRCIDCLKNECIPDVALEYLTDKEDCLEHFAFTVLFKINPPCNTSFELRETLKEVASKLATKKDFEDYIFDEMDAPDDFADWLNKKEVK